MANPPRTALVSGTCLLIFSSGALFATAVYAGWKTWKHLRGRPPTSGHLEHPADRLSRWKRLKIVAHRGSNAYDEGDEDLAGPENTLRAYRLALDEAGVDGIEIDVQLTKDDQLIIMHDSTVDRTTGSTGEVRQRTLDEIRQLDAGDGDNVPTLDEVFDLLRDHPAAELHIDIKPAINDPEISLGRIREAAARFAAASPEVAIYPRIFLNCWNPVYLAAAVRILPQCPRIFLFPVAPDLGIFSFFHEVVLGAPRSGFWEKLRSFLVGFDPVDRKYELHPAEAPDSELFGYSIQSTLLGLTPSFARRSQRRGRRVQAWTCENRDQLVRAVDWLGVEAVLTDRPALIKRIKLEMIAELEGMGGD